MLPRHIAPQTADCGLIYLEISDSFAGNGRERKLPADLSETCPNRLGYI
jgi:hypothetical protein